MSDSTSVSPMDPNKKNSPVANPMDEQATVMLSHAKTTCSWNAQEFTDGQLVECEGKRYECSYGQWVPLD